MTRWLFGVALVVAATVAVFFWLSPPRRPVPSKQVYVPEPTRTGQPQPSPDSSAALAVTGTQAAAAVDPDSTATALALATPETRTVAVPTSRPGSVRPPDPPDFSDPPPSTVMENARSVFRHYRSMFNSNPVGTNPEITAALNGRNPKQAKLIREADGLRINEKGELIDPWRTPFFFHQLSATEMEIHCAGPDRVMWTADDLVIR